MNPIRQALQTLPGHWYQGGLSNVTGTRKCGMGHLVNAINDIHGIQPGRDWPRELWNLHGEAAKFMGEAALDKFPDRTWNSGYGPQFPSFNDNKETTEQDVIDVLTLAADRWDAEVDS